MDAYPATTDPTAVVGRRFGAYVIDSIVIAAIFWGLFFATAGIVLYERPATCAQVEAKAGELSSSERCADGDQDLDITINDDHYSAVTWKPAAWIIAGGAALLYLIIVEWIIQAMTGATLGKAIFGIRTVDEQGNAPGLGKQFVRGVLWIVDGLCYGLVALVLILASKGHRRLGDMAAKTFVVRSNAKGAPIVVAGLTDDGAGAPMMAGAYAASAATPASTYAPPAPGTMGTTPPMTAPAPAATQDPTTQAAAPAAAAASGPQWDAARNAYIQWDPNSGRWLTYDDAAAEWKPIEGDQPPSPS